MRLGDDVELVVGAQDHVLPLGERGQADIGDRGVEGGLVAVDFAFVGQHEVAAAYVETTVASGDGFLGDADEGQRGVLVELLAEGALGLDFEALGAGAIAVDENGLVAMVV